MWESIVAAVSEVGKWLGESSGGGTNGGSLIKGVTGALGLAGGLGRHSTPVANAQPFHYQSSASPDKILSGFTGYAKNDINENKAFNSLKDMF